MDKPVVKENTNTGMRDKRGTRAPRRGSSFNRPKPEFDQKILSIRRVTRVVAGGRRFSFSVALVAGDKKGGVGLGLGKAGDTSLAINKALRNAKKNMVRVKLTKTMSIPHEVKAKFSSAQVMLMPNRGRGLVAGSVVRDIIKLAGIKDITGKILSSTKNKLNNAKAVMEALSTFSTKFSKPVVETAVVANKEIPVEGVVS
ncbi:MAG TPA: 30S ribosomal protein S5 [Candidatus Paceibacterota bacterium]